MINVCDAEYEALPASLAEYCHVVYFVFTGEILQTRHEGVVYVYYISLEVHDELGQLPHKAIMNMRSTNVGILFFTVKHAFGSKNCEMLVRKL